MWRRVDRVWTDFSEKRIALIFKVENPRARNQRGSLQPPAHAGSSLADFSILKVEVICSSETSVHTRSTRRYIPKDDILQVWL
jgi:hypothetical protein